MKNHGGRGWRKDRCLHFLTTFTILCALLLNTFAGTLWGNVAFGTEVDPSTQVQSTQGIENKADLEPEIDLENQVPLSLQTVQAPLKINETVFQQAINKSTGYFTIIKKGNQDKATLDGFWQMAAIKACGLSLDDYKLSNISSNSLDYEKYFYYYLKGDIQEATAVAQNIAVNQNVQTGALSSIYTYHIWNCIVLSVESKTNETLHFNEEKSIDYLLSLGNSNGSYGLNGAGDTDLTGMALIALSFYSGQDKVDEAIGKAVNFLKAQQSADGGFSGLYGENINSAAAAISGLQAVGQDLNGAEWIKNGNTVQDYVIGCMNQNGSFGNDLATEQGLIALVELSSAKCIWSYLGNKIVPFTVIPDGTPEQVDPGDAATRVSISFRVEGAEKNLLYIPYLTVKAGDHTLSVRDALEQALKDSKINYELQGSYLKSIAGEQTGKFGGFDGWMYMVNGKEATTSMDQQLLSNGDDVVFFYGVFGTFFPKLIMNQNTDSIEITFMSEAYDEFGMLNDSPIAEAIVTVFGKSYITDAMGKIIVGKADYIDCKESKLQIAKIAQGTESDGWGGTHPKGASLVVRLSPDYTIKFAEDGTLMQPINATESAIEVNPSQPLNITVLPGMTRPSLKLNGSLLPQIEIQNGHIMMNLSSNTKVFTDKTDEGSLFTGSMELPTFTSVKNFPGNKLINVAIKVGISSGDLYFSQPIRLLIPGGKGLSTGILKSDGTIKEITEIVQEDSLQAAKDKIKNGVEEVKIAVGNDMAVWTNHLSTYVSYSENNSPDPNNPPNAQVTLYVEGVGRFTIPYTSGMTPLGILLEKVGNVSHKGGYVSGINGRMEFAEGPGSGWMYAVNGTYYKVGADTTALKAGDYVEWRYTKNFGDDLTGSNWAPENATAGALSNPESLKKLAEVKEAALKNIEGKSAYTLSDFEIMVLALADKEKKPQQFERLQDSIIQQVKNGKGNFRKVTDRARIVLAARSVKLQPSNIGGYNMVESLVNHENIEMQGVNGPGFALIAYDATGLKLPANTLNSRENLKKIILGYQNADGGYPLAKGGKSDPDVTAMVLTALAPYQKEETVKKGTDKAIAYLSSVQKPDGGFLSQGISTSESVSQVIIALCALGIDPLDSRFVKGEKGEFDLLSNLFSFQNKDGGFSHTLGEKTDTMATEQGSLAILAYEKLLNRDGKQGVCIYDMQHIKYNPFLDESEIASWAKTSVNNCQQLGIMTGDERQNFLPKRNLNRAEASKIMASILQLPPYLEPSSGSEESIEFQDVLHNAWYYETIRSAVKAGVLSGRGEGVLDPEGSISREELAVILVRSLGLPKEKAVGESELIIPLDMDTVSPYAKEAVMIAYSGKLMQGSDGNFDPKGKVSREMIAVIMERIYEQYFK